jgi:N-acetylglucosamine-6-sulfatase
LEASPEVLENTYIIYTTDRGFHIGQHRLPPVKSCGIEEDVNSPFFIHVPGIAKNATQTVPTSHTNIVPTLFHLAGIPLRADFDGESIAVTPELLANNDKSEHINIEFWGDYLVEGNVFYGNSALKNNTYKTVRVVSDEVDPAYTVWCTNEHELYGMSLDPHQLHNLLATENHKHCEINNWSVARLVSRLDAPLLTLKRCEGRVCTSPSEKPHPRGNVRNLKDAMNKRYDGFNMEQHRKVTFEECVLGQVLSVEGALEPVVWRDEWDSWSWGT